jgi:hypothetical protein
MRFEDVNDPEYRAARDFGYTTTPADGAVMTSFFLEDDAEEIMAGYLS